MLVYEYKLSGTKQQYATVDEAIHIVQFIRNKSLHLWMDKAGTSKAVPPQYTRLACSKCRTIVKKTLSVRTHICTACGVVLDRDHNAAHNILKKTLLKGTEGHSGTNERNISSNASGQTASTASPKQKSGKRTGRKKNPLH